MTMVDLDELAGPHEQWCQNHAQCGDGHKHGLFPADGPGRGNWRGVEFA